MRLTIFGASGTTGRRLLERAIAEGNEVTAFVRNPSKLAAHHERLSVMGGDVFDPGRVGEAVAGSEAVVSVLGGARATRCARTRPGTRTGRAPSVRGTSSRR